MKILGFILGSIVLLWCIYSLTLALAQAISTGVASTPIRTYNWYKQPVQFIATVLVQAIFWLGLIAWWLNGVWNLWIKLVH